MHVRSLPTIWLEVAPARSSDYWTVRAQSSNFRTVNAGHPMNLKLCKSVQPEECRFRECADLCNDRIVENAGKNAPAVLQRAGAVQFVQRWRELRVG